MGDNVNLRTNKPWLINYGSAKKWKLLCIKMAPQLKQPRNLFEGKRFTLTSHDPHPFFEEKKCWSKISDVRLVFVWNWANRYSIPWLQRIVFYAWKLPRNWGVRCTTFLEQARCTHVLLAKREGSREREREREKQWPLLIRSPPKPSHHAHVLAPTHQLGCRIGVLGGSPIRVSLVVPWWPEFGTPRGLCKRSCTKALNCKSCWTWDEHRATKMVGCLCKRCLNTFLGLKHDQDSQTAAEDDF